jgi:hypothetical protein
MLFERHQPTVLRAYLVRRASMDGKTAGPPECRRRGNGVNPAPRLGGRRRALRPHPPSAILCEDPTVKPWIVIVRWFGEPQRLQPLFAALLHLEPTPVGRGADVKVTVAATDAEAARLYVLQLLRREGFAGSAVVTGVELASEADT